MERLTTVQGLRAYVHGATRPLGLVPTMGALHAGHMSLVNSARADCTTLLATIFVNPKQFGPTEDFSRYPRPVDADLAKLSAAGVDAVYIPSVDEMYAESFATTVAVAGPALPLEGEARPGHLDGVSTVVTKLLIQSLPDRVYLGQKDGQQSAVVRRLVTDLDMPVEVVVLPTVREADGLAVSSRNAYMTLEQRTAASVIYRALAATRDKFRAGGQDRAELEASCLALLNLEPLIETVDYVAVVNADSMRPWGGNGPCMLAVAVRIGDVRLIDNVVMD
jgi:pantoate--beta-alanine ligase